MAGKNRPKYPSGINGGKGGCSYGSTGDRVGPHYNLRGAFKYTFINGYLYLYMFTPWLFFQSHLIFALPE
jgi:hypothetical protein